MSSSVSAAAFTYSTNYSHCSTPVKSSIFTTHTSIHAERLHQVSEWICIPAKYNAQFFARVINPLPGAHKHWPLLATITRIGCLALWILSLPFAIASFLIGFPLRCIDHWYRPVVSCLESEDKSKAKQVADLNEQNPLHVRTHNLGFVTSTVSIVGDLRPPTTRASEVAKAIVEDPHKPDIIFFQEAFHEDATRVLCEGIQNEYPYIIHSVLPQISGFNSGALIASKYPLEQIEFHRLENMLGPETMSPRGIIKVCIQSAQGPVSIYGVHTQALLGEERAECRYLQLEQIKRVMEQDRNAKILLGDFNTSAVTAWGDDNSSQADQKVMRRLNEFFHDFYIQDHDPKTGQRTDGMARFLDSDNRRMGQVLREPSGSWYHGPFADPGVLFSFKMWFDRWKHGRASPDKMEGITLESPATWGTDKWYKNQTANTARFDYILQPQGQNLKGRVEIRRVVMPDGSQSAASDHLPVDGLLWV